MSEADGYEYAAQRQELFTEEGQVRFLNVRDKVHALLETAGAFRMDKAGCYSWEDMACIDRLVELGEIVEWPRSCWGQYRVFASPKVHNR